MTVTHSENLCNSVITDRICARIGRAHAEKRLLKEIRYENAYTGDTAATRWKRRDTRAAMVRAFLFITRTAERARRNAASVQLDRTVVRLSRLPPAFNGFRILHISDTHGDISPDAMNSLRKMLPQLDYDICVLTGDYRGLSRGSTEAALLTFKSLIPLIKTPIYGILGNHDSVLMLEPLENMGIVMLMNENTAIRRDGSCLHIMGVDDPHHYKCDDIERSGKGIAEHECRILLSHSPETYKKAESAGADFILCGHTHGGQICMPGGKALSDGCKIKLLPGMISGIWKYGRMTGYTSTGVGTSSLPARLNCPPSVAIHVLQSPLPETGAL